MLAFPIWWSHCSLVAFFVQFSEELAKLNNILVLAMLWNQHQLKKQELQRYSRKYWRRKAQKNFGNLPKNNRKKISSNRFKPFSQQDYCPRNHICQLLMKIRFLKNNTTWILDIVNVCFSWIFVAFSAILFVLT